MTERITDEQRAALVVDLRTKRVAGGGNMIPHMVMDEAADLIEAQAAELATLRAKVAELEAEKADTRVVTVEQLRRWVPYLAASDFRAEIRAIIEGAEK